LIVTLLTDYGREDDFVGVCHGVIRRIAPEVRIVNITHGIPRFEVRHGAIVLRNTLPYMPVGVHMAVVDPQVGTGRRAVAIRCRDGRVLVGPDNGLLSLAWEQAEGVDLAVDVTRSPHRLEPVSATFHGRDVFAPVAAHLAAGAELADAGEPVDADSLERIELPEPRMEDDVLVAHVVTVDRFGNASLDARPEDLMGIGATLGERVALDLGDGELHQARYARTFAEASAGDLIIYEDAYRAVALAVNRRDAASSLGLRIDSEVRLSRR
jgi:S-adenosylmethionine hydrolase